MVPEGSVMTSAIARITSFSQRRSQTIALPLPGGTLLRAHGGLGGKRPPTVAYDLLDLAATVFNLERQLTGRQRTDPVGSIELRFPARSGRSWSKTALTLVENVLRFLGNAQWRVSTSNRQASEEPELSERYSGRAKRLVLFSGGLDSWCGAAVSSRSDTRLMSFYTRQKAMQADLAADLGYPAPVQWCWRKALPRGRGRSFYYRSFLFQSLAAVTAATLGSEEILQFENGVLASAVAPSPAYRMTRHAHPHFLAMMQRLISLLFRRDIRLHNPFVLTTKRQAAEAAKKAIGLEAAVKAISVTQSCWGYWAPRLQGGGKKRPGKHCGVCIPCIVRRTAFPEGRYARDLTIDRWKNSPACGLHFRAYHGFLERVRDAAEDDARFFLLLDGAARTDLIGRGYQSPSQLRSLYTAFADEFQETFLG